MKPAYVPLLQEEKAATYHTTAVAPTTGKLGEQFSWDVVFVFRTGDPSKRQDGVPQPEVYSNEINRVLNNLDQANLKFTLYKSLNEEYILCLIGATEDRLKVEADRTDFDLKLDQHNCLKEALKLGVRLAKQTVNNQVTNVTESIWDNLYGPYESYDEAFAFRQNLYRRYNDTTLHRDSLFRTVDRIKLIYSIIEAHPTLGGAGLPVGLLTADNDNPLVASFPLHEETARQRLLRKWDNWWSFQRQPLLEIRDYFGEQIAFYFAFLQFYNKALYIPAILGVGMFIWQMVAQRIDVPGTAFFAIIICFWATLLLELWKRNEAYYRIQWGMTNFEMTEQPRPEFTGTPAVSEVDGTIQEVFELKEKIKRTMLSQSVIWTLIGVVIASVAGIFVFRELIVKDYPTTGGIIAGVVNAVQINILNAIYAWVSEKLNIYENHRTDTEYEDALIAKSFLFKFVNSYNSLFYIAFIKRYDSGAGGCNGSCLPELRQQLATIFITQLVVNNLIEYGLPLLKKTRTKKYEAVYTEAKSQPEKEFDLPVYEGTFSDFDEIVIQYGYVVLFVAAFPLTPLLALINNVVESRLDASKLLRLTRRPEPKGAGDIGTWYTIINIVGYISVITNVAIVAFETSLGDDLANSESDKKLLIFLLTEHLIFLIKFAIGYFVPDEPVSVINHQARQQYIVSLLIQGMEEERDKPEDLQEAKKAKEQQLRRAARSESKAQAYFQLSTLSSHNTQPQFLNTADKALE